MEYVLYFPFIISLSITSVSPNHAAKWIGATSSKNTQNDSNYKKSILLLACSRINFIKWLKLKKGVLIWFTVHTLNNPGLPFLILPLLHGACRANIFSSLLLSNPVSELHFFSQNFGFSTIPFHDEFTNRQSREFFLSKSSKMSWEMCSRPGFSMIVSMMLSVQKSITEYSVG